MASRNITTSESKPNNGLLFIISLPLSALPAVGLFIIWLSGGFTTMLNSELGFTWIPAQLFLLAAIYLCFAAIGWAVRYSLSLIPLDRTAYEPTTVPDEMLDTIRKAAKAINIIWRIYACLVTALYSFSMAYSCLIIWEAVTPKAPRTVFGEAYRFLVSVPIFLFGHFLWKGWLKYHVAAVKTELVPTKKSDYKGKGKALGPDLDHEYEAPGQ